MVKDNEQRIYEAMKIDMDESEWSTDMNNVSHLHITFRIPRWIHRGIHRGPYDWAGVCAETDGIGSIDFPDDE